MIYWWNGVSACYDMTNPEASAYLETQLCNTQKKYGIDGYKFDAGDVAHFTDEYTFMIRMLMRVHFLKNGRN